MGPISNSGSESKTPSVQPPGIIKVIQLLDAADIPCCVVGTRALRYFGAGRVADEWDLCISDNQLDKARQLIEKSGKYEATERPLPTLDNLRHKYATFKPKKGHDDDDGGGGVGGDDADFSFLLAPSSDCFCDPRPEFCERSHTGVPYPQDVSFAKALLVKQSRADLADFIDAQNLDGEWGGKNIDFDRLQAQGLDYAKRMNAKFDQDPESPGRMHVGRDLKKDWMRVAESKEKRIEPLKQGRYITRWRTKKRPEDPRLNYARKGV